MQCAKFERRLQQLLDDRQNVEMDESLRDHAQRCDACSRIWRTQTQLFAGLKLFHQPDVAFDLGPRVLERLRVDQRKRRSRRFALAALATAAAIMIALLPLAGDHARFWPPRGGNLTVAAISPSPSARQRSTNTLTEQEAQDIRLMMRELMRFSTQRLSMFEPVDQFASGIRPLAITFNFALDTLRRTLPGYSEPQAVEPQARHGQPLPPVS